MIANMMIKQRREMMLTILWMVGDAGCDVCLALAGDSDTDDDGDQV